MLFAWARSGRGTNTRARRMARVLRTSLLILAVLLVGTGATQAAKKKAAAHRKAKAHPPPPTWIFQKPANVVPNQQGKVVVFPFRNDDGNLVSTQVGHLLESRGLELVTGMRPVESAEQYRDVATHLGLVAYVDGDVRGTEANPRVVVRLRNGYTGRTVSQAVFTESRSNLAREISDKLWTKMASAIARACADASKPRKLSRTTLRINAGTPIDTVPARAP